MESWENKTIKEKMDSLQDLPAGYLPNLSSKWEIIEAGLPEKKRRGIPVLMRWSVAATIVAAIFLIGVKINQHTAPQIELSTLTYMPQPAINSFIVEKQITISEVDLTEENKSYKKQISQPAPAKEITKKQEQQLLVKEEQLIDIIDKNQDTLIAVTNELVTVISQPEIPKRAKRRTFQKDFNDGLIVMDTGHSKPANSQFSFKLRLHTSAEENNQSSPRLQLKQIL